MEENMSNKPSIIIPAIIVIAFMASGYFLGSAIKGQIFEEEKTTFGGWSGPVRDLFGTRVGTSTTPLIWGNNNDLSTVATTSKRVALLQGTDTALFTIYIPAASTTNAFYWHILGSNDADCDTIATSTTDDNYVATKPLVSDIHWFNVDQTDDYNNSSLVNVVGNAANATGTSFSITDVNWGCFKIDARGASTTVWMQLKEKILTTP